MKHTFSPDVLALNPGLKTERVLAKESQLEAKFILLWQCLNGPMLEKEVRFHPQRKWRADFGFQSENLKLLIEIEGGTRGKSRHTSHAGYKSDCEKYTEASKLGYVIYRLTYDMITTDKLQEIIDYITQRQAASAAPWAGVRE